MAFLLTHHSQSSLIALPGWPWVSAHLDLVWKDPSHSNMDSSLCTSISVDPCRYNPIKTIKTSFLGTMNMLGLAKRTNARFLLTSTSEVLFGDPEDSRYFNINK